LGISKKKNTKKHAALRGNYSGPAYATDPVKVSKYTASLVACTRKKQLFG